MKEQTKNNLTKLLKEWFTRTEALQKQVEKLGIKCKVRLMLDVTPPHTLIICNKCGTHFDPEQHRIGWNAVKCPNCGNTIMHIKEET